MDIYNLVSFAGIFVLIGFAGVAMVASNVLAFYIFCLKKQFPTIAVLAAATLAFLMTACVAGTFFAQGKESILLGD